MVEIVAKHRECHQIPCPDICDELREHSHWRCDDCQGWMYYPGFGAWFDLFQPARIIYPHLRKEEA